MDSERRPATTDQASPDRAALDEVIESARRIGVELDAAEAASWVAAMEMEAAGGDLVVDVDSGDLRPPRHDARLPSRDLARFRAMARSCGFPDRPPHVLTALALSGSAAQSKIQTYPGDCDYFERVNITADTREEACAILADLMREKALATRVGPTHRLSEVKFGSYPRDAERGRVARSGPGRPDLVDGRRDPRRPDRGSPRRRLAPGRSPGTRRAAEPGWCKLDWVVADPVRGQLANASNMLDVTWEAPDGTITPLDGVPRPVLPGGLPGGGVDPDLLASWSSELSADALDDYVGPARARGHGSTRGKDPNYGKAAKRMYNVFRLTGRYAEAAYLRELFDEPATVLYQVAALIRTLDEARPTGRHVRLRDDRQAGRRADHVRHRGPRRPAEAEMVRLLLAVRSNLRGRRGSAGRSAEVDEVKDEALRAVNDYFERRLTAVPEIKAYLDELAARP